MQCLAPPSGELLYDKQQNTLFNVLKNASLFNISKPISKKKKKSIYIVND